MRGTPPTNHGRRLHKGGAWVGLGQGLIPTPGATDCARTCASQLARGTRGCPVSRPAGLWTTPLPGGGTRWREMPPCLCVCGARSQCVLGVQALGGGARHTAVPRLAWSQQGGLVGVGPVLLVRGMRTRACPTSSRLLSSYTIVGACCWSPSLASTKLTRIPLPRRTTRVDAPTSFDPTGQCSLTSWRPTRSPPEPSQPRGWGLWRCEQQDFTVQ